MNKIISKSVHITETQDQALDVLAKRRAARDGRKPTSRELFIEGLSYLPGYTEIYKELIQKEQHAKQDN